jgi:hypothetical protein
MKSANGTLKCISYFYSNIPEDIFLNIFRIGIFVLYLIWIIIAFKFKELRNRQMVFLLNLCATGMFYSVNGFTTFFYTPCDILPQSTCYAQTILTVFQGYYTGYSLSALAIHRLVCVVSINASKNLKWRTICVLVSLIWIIPLIFSFIQINGFQSNIYFDVGISNCVYDASSSRSSFSFFIIFAIILPNLMIFVSLLITFIKLKQKKDSLKLKNKRTESLRIALLLTILIIMYEISCISHALIIYQTSQMIEIVSSNELVFLRLGRWLIHICPLGFLYFHPLLVNKYKKVFNISMSIRTNTVEPI